MSSKLKKVIACASMLVMLPMASFATTGTVDGNAVRLRKEPSSEARIITLLEKGKTGEILEETEGWYKVTVNNATGWVSADYFKKDEVPVIVETINEETESKTGLKNVVIDTAVVNIRKEPTTDSTVLSQATQGQLLEVVGESEADDGVWYKIKLDEEEYGYVRSDLITSDISQAKSEGKVTGSVVNIRKEPTTEARSVGKLTEGTIVEINGIEGEWYKISYEKKEGYIHSEYLEALTPVTSRSGVSSSKVRKVIDIVKSQLGKRYVWGAEGPNSFDCSGLMKYAYGQVGITLNRVSSDQASNGIAVSRSNLQPGDLVFFRGINSSSSSTRISHVGIYIGNNEFIHAANSKRGVVKDDLTESYYSSHYVTARRIIR